MSFLRTASDLNDEGGGGGRDVDVCSLRKGEEREEFLVSVEWPGDGGTPIQGILQQAIQQTGRTRSLEVKN